jgi:hypothetical protein
MGVVLTTLPAAAHAATGKQRQQTHLMAARSAHAHLHSVLQLLASPASVLRATTSQQTQRAPSVLLGSTHLSLPTAHLALALAR